jgi:hypothetical protein
MIQNFNSDQDKIRLIANTTFSYQTKENSWENENSFQIKNIFPRISRWLSSVIYHQGHFLLV